MRNTRRVDDGTPSERVASLFLWFAVVENSFLFLVCWWLAPDVLVVLAPGIACLTYLLRHWLRFRGVNAGSAVLWTSLAAMAWPWFTFIPAEHRGPNLKGVDWILLIGPLLPYTAVAAAGLRKQRKEESR